MLNKDTYSVQTNNNYSKQTLATLTDGTLVYQALWYEIHSLLDGFPAVLEYLVAQEARG